MESIDGVQMLHYMTMLFPRPSEVTEQENLRLLPRRNAEIVLHTKQTMEASDGGDISQLIVQCRVHMFSLRWLVWLIWH